MPEVIRRVKRIPLSEERKPLTIREKVALDLRTRGISHHERIALDVQERGLRARDSSMRSANKFIGRGIALRENMEHRASKVFNRDEKFFNVDNVFSRSDVESVRLIKPVKSSFFFPAKKRKSTVSRERSLLRQIRKERKKLEALKK